MSAGRGAGAAPGLPGAGHLQHPSSVDEGHSQLQGCDGSWIWVQLVTFLGCSFSFPARSAQRWRRWQLHGSAVPVAAVRPREDAGEAAAAPPVWGQRLLPGTEPPFRALPGFVLAAPHPSHSTDHPQHHSGTGASRVLSLAVFVPVAPWGAPGGPVAVPAFPFPLQPKRPRCHQGSSMCVLLPCLPQRPQPSSGGTAGGGRAEGAQWGRRPCSPRLCRRESRAFPARAQIQGWWGLGPLVVLGVVAGCHQGCQSSCSWPEQQFLPGQDLLPSCGSCEPAVTPIPLQGWAAAGLAVGGDGLGDPTLLSAAPGAALLLGRGWSSTTTMSSLSLAPFT